MKVLHALKEYDNTKPATVTIGSFDGVHLGHNLVLSQLNSIAKQQGTLSVVLTFAPHPRVFFNKKARLKLLNTESEKIALLADKGVDVLIIQAFDATFAEQSPEIFIKKLVSRLQMQHLLIGYDHSFGKNKAGNFEFIQNISKEFNFKTHRISSYKLEQDTISSTLIREALQDGKITNANKYLGYQYAIEGVVVKGNQLGRTIGFPTANIEVSDKNKLMPKQGVYVVRAMVDRQQVYGMMNLGIRPTVDGKKMVIEVYLFDFNSNIYGKEIKVSFVQRLRNEQKFSSVTALKEQLILDEKKSRIIISKL